jgi:branched-chain amino acid transport system ATP-binding protein
MSSKTILSVSELSKNFGGVQALAFVSFDLERGSILGIIGPNGSGKTTLVNLITGFVRPSTGQVIYQGVDITGWKTYKVIRQGIARTFQMVKPFYSLPAYKNLIAPLYSPRVKKELSGRYGNLDAVALDYLEDVGFERDSFVAYKEASALPQGYLKRLELAKAMALRPSLLILDEIFSGLSLSEVASIVPIIRKLAHEGVTIMMVEHRLRELFRISDRVIVLNYGCKIYEGEPDEVMRNEKVQKAYLGTEVEFA